MAPWLAALPRNCSFNGCGAQARDNVENLELMTGKSKIFKKLSQTNSPTPAAAFAFQDVHPDSVCEPLLGVVYEAARASADPGRASVCEEGVRRLYAAKEGT